jgi:hypothetical protein
MTLSDRSGISTSSLQSRESNTCLQRSLIQCCGIVMIYCGSGPVPTLEKFRFRFQFRFRYRLRFRPRFWIQTIFRAQFFNNKNMYKILPFQCQQKKQYFPEVAISFFFLLFYSIFCWIQIKIRLRNWNRNAFLFRFN